MPDGRLLPFSAATASGCVRLKLTPHCSLSTRPAGASWAGSAPRALPDTGRCAVLLIPTHLPTPNPSNPGDIPILGAWAGVRLVWDAALCGSLRGSPSPRLWASGLLSGRRRPCMLTAPAWTEPGALLTVFSLGHKRGTQARRSDLGEAGNEGSSRTEPHPCARTGRGPSAPRGSCSEMD